MKLSELPHRDPAWAYIELNDGSLVAIPKYAIEELQAENEQLKKDLEHARSYKHTIKMRNRNLQAENKRLEGEVNRLEANEEHLADEQVIILDERDNLLKENAKLKCLALHAMSELFGYKTLFFKKKKLRTKYGQFANKFYEAHRKAKKELMEGK